ncbi:STAS-like domain-containing protein [Chloroflexota bacterium]
MNNEIREYILNNVAKHPSKIAAITAQEYKVSRASTAQYLRKLVSQGLLNATGHTKGRRYELRNFIDKTFRFDVTLELQEDIEWREKILPFMEGLTENILAICQYGFTEMLRNIKDHSQSNRVLIGVERNAVNIRLVVRDYGIGIFNKIQNDFNLYDPRHALLELSKGKLTSDPNHHSGEGIFFTSRMFDKFCILSRPLFFLRTNKENEDWLLEVKDRPKEKDGTFITMDISPNTKRTLQEVFDKFSPNSGEYGFSKTHIPIELARYEGEQLVSRSQAQRLVARFERFEEVLLDFKNVAMVGQSFADEIFRVYQLAHPQIRVVWVNAEPNVEKMILHVMANKAVHP